MTRLRSVALFTALAAGVVPLATFPAVAQETKQKAKQRIAISEPKELTTDADFATQGEYVGKSEDGKETLAAQVIAKGDGNFDVKYLSGGLPGAGWDGKTTKMAKAVRVESKVVVKEGDKEVGTIAGGVITNADSKGFPLKKVERKSPTLGAKPPEGAEVLFGKEGDEANWIGGKLVTLSDGKYLNMGIKSKKSYGSFLAHVEFRLPWMPNSSGQGRGNSGVYLQDRYEVQVLDSFGLKGLNNECGGVYTQYSPSVNMCLPPMVWQTYDIEFKAATYENDKKTKPAILTLIHNGVKIHDQIELKGQTGGGQAEGPKPGPFQLQNHGDPLVYRNIWVVESK